MFIPEWRKEPRLDEFLNRNKAGRASAYSNNVACTLLAQSGCTGSPDVLNLQMQSSVESVSSSAVWLDGGKIDVHQSTELIFSKSEIKSLDETEHRSEALSFRIKGDSRRSSTRGSHYGFKYSRTLEVNCDLSS